MSRRDLATCLLLACSASVVLAGDDDATVKLRFGWSVPARVGVTELDDDALKMHYTLVVERDADARLHVRCDDLRLTEYAGRSADNPAIASQIKLLETFVRGQRPELLVNADARTAEAPDAVQHFSAAIDELARSDDLDVGRAVPVVRKQVDALRSDPLLAQAFKDRAAAPWRWAVGTWSGLPVRAGTVFEGDVDVASEIDGVVTSTLHVTVSATPIADVAGRWTFTFKATGEGARVRASLSHGDLANASDAKRTVEIVSVIDADALRPRRVDYTEALEATIPGEDFPRRSHKVRVLEFEWDPPLPPVAPTAQDLRAIDATASNSMEAWRAGDAAKLRDLLPPSRRRADREEKVEPWPTTWSWTPFKRRLDGDWALVAVRLMRGEEGEQVWPLLLHREGGAWFVLGEGFAPAETGLITHGMNPPAPRWMEPQLEDWTVDAMSVDPSAEIVLGAPPRAFEFAAGRGRVLWFKLTAAHTVELRAESKEDVTPHVGLVMASGVIHPTREGTKRVHVAAHTLRPGTYGLAVGVERAGTLLVSLSDVTATELALGTPIGPRRVRDSAPLRLRVRTPSPRDVVIRAVRVAGRGGDAELVLNTETGKTEQSNRGGVVHCREAADVMVTVATLSDGEAECFVLAELDGTTDDKTPPLHPGETRELDLPANGAVVVHIAVPDRVAWSSSCGGSPGSAVTTGEYHDDRGGGVIVASNGGPTRVQLRIDLIK